MLHKTPRRAFDLRACFPGHTPTDRSLSAGIACIPVVMPASPSQPAVGRFFPSDTKA